MLVSVLLLGGASVARGQSRGDKDGKPTITVDFGLTGVIWPERWTPITVSLTCGPLPFDGLLAVEYQQDSTQTAQIIRPVAGTPNKTVSVQMMVSVPPSCRRIEVSLFDRSRGLGSRPVQRLVFAQNPDRDELPLPTMTTRGGRAGPVVVGVGSASGPAAAVSMLSDFTTGESAVPNTTVHAALVSAAHLPLVWAGYDGVLFLAAEADASLSTDPRALAAVREWVSAGGRLVIFVTTVSSEWCQWLPPQDSADGRPRLPVQIDPPTEGPAPDGLAEALRAQIERIGTARDKALAAMPETALPDHGGRPVPPSPSESEAPAAARPALDTPAAAPNPGPEPAASLAYRPIRLTEFGAAGGWSVRWPVSGAGGAGVLAEGPVGFGWVTVVGFDPRRAATMVSAAATRAAWTGILENALADWRVASVPPDAKNYYAANTPESGSLSLAPTIGQAARSAVLDRLSDVPAAGSEVFPLIVAAMVVLALLIGPVDAIMLRRLRLRHRSWATALGWIALASLATYGAPGLSRSSVTHVGRVSAIDAIAPRPGPQGQDDPPPLAWRSSLSGVFAGRTARVEFTGATAGAWWRGVSALSSVDYYGRQNRSHMHAAGRATQLLPDLGALAVGDRPDPWGGFGVGSPGAGGNHLAPAYLRLWTFRTFQDQARVNPPLGAAVEPVSADGEDGWRVHLFNVPDGAIIANAMLRLGSDWYSLEFPKEPGAAGRRVGVAGKRRGDAAEFLATAPENPELIYGRWGVQAQTLFKPGLALGLPGADRRAMAIRRMAESGRWAAVYLQLDDMPPDVRADGAGDAVYKHTVVCRLLVPLGGSPGSAVTPVPAEEPVGDFPAPSTHGGPPR